MKRAKTRVHRDYSHEVRKHRYLWVRIAFATLGVLFLVIGIIGVFLPLLPTTPFLLLATACFARSSHRFYNWLMNHPAFGPLIIEWRTYRSIPWRVKLIAIAMMLLTIGSSVLFFLHDVRLQLAMTVVGLTLAVWLYRIPSRDRPDKRKT